MNFLLLSNRTQREVARHTWHTGKCTAQRAEKLGKTEREGALLGDFRVASCGCN